MRTYTIYRYFLLLVAVIAFIQCSVFLEDDIEEEKVSILAPADGTLTEIVTHTFWWETITGADKYRLQIVTPSFTEAENLLLDSLISGDKFETTLYAGDYQWRVRGENSAYQTSWNTAGLKIVSSDDLTRQKVRLRQPLENYFTNATELHFKWDTLEFVDSYELLIYEGVWGQNLLLDSMGIEVDKVAIELDEAELYWGVRAINEKSESLYNNQRMVVDLTKPNKPELLSPINNVSLADTTVNFTWNSSDPKWNEVIDSLFIYEERAVLGDRLVYSDVHTEAKASVKLNSDKKYIWLVKSVDKAGNEGIDSEAAKFQTTN